MSLKFALVVLVATCHEVKRCKDCRVIVQRYANRGKAGLQCLPCYTDETGNDTLTLRHNKIEIIGSSKRGHQNAGLIVEGDVEGWAEHRPAVEKRAKAAAASALAKRLKRQEAPSTRDCSEASDHKSDHDVMSEKNQKASEKSH